MYLLVSHDLLCTRVNLCRYPEALKRELGEYDPLPLAIAGDQTAHLLWRLDNGGTVRVASSCPHPIAWKRLVSALAPET
jgi:hypothetical protein